MPEFPPGPVAAPYPSTGDSYSRPLTREHFDQLKRAQRSLHDALELVDRQERCGEDCLQFRQMIDLLSKRLEAYEREYFPHGV